MNLQAMEEQLHSMKIHIMQIETELNKLKTPTYQEEVTTSDDIYIKVTKLMQMMQIPPNLLGYYYIRTAATMIYEEASLLEAITKQLYPSVAKVHGKTANKIERSIRHAIETAWNKATIHNMKQVFGNRVYGDKPTNTEFLATIVDYLRLNELVDF